METTDAETPLLKKKYDLHKQPEVEFAARRIQSREGERIPQDPLLRIQNYLDRFREITDREDPARREHGINAMKRLMYKKYVIKPDEIPESYFENQRRLAREQGHGDIEITQQARDQLTEVIITDQRSSLDKWIDYLSSSDAPYSDSLKYFTLRSVLGMGEYDKERKAFTTRSKGTVKPFPDLNREALAYVLDVVSKKYKGQNIDLAALEEKDSQEFEKLLAGENFAKLYAWAIEKITPATQEELAATGGEWVKYPCGSNPLPLVKSLQGHGTGWCTAGESTAETQLQGGDFYVYYSLDKSGKPTVPRIAIRMEGSRIAEVRGIAPEQNLDSAAVAIVEEKLKEFPDGPSYQKRVADMRHVTEIENKVKKHQELSARDLVFLYEIDVPIEGFGYDKDPRIEEIRSQRNIEEDMPIVFGCTKEQIAHMPDKIDGDTKAYVGPLAAGIFDKLRLHKIEHIYTSFPEGKIRHQEIEIGGKTSEQLQVELREAGINVTSYTEDLMRSPDFTTLPSPQMLGSVRLRVADLGLRKYPTTDEIYQKAQELGLELCPAEVGPYLRLKDTKQPLGGWYFIGMKQVAGRSGDSSVFGLGCDEDGLWLSGSWVKHGGGWSPWDGFVFALRK